MPEPRDLERELRAVRVSWPESPDLAGGLRLAPHRDRRRRPRARWAVALAALALAGVAAVEPARSAVLEFLGLKSVRVERREPVATPAPPGADLDLGRSVTQAQAQRLARGFRPVPPAALGDPGGIYFSSGPPRGGAVTYVYGRGPELLVTLFAPSVSPFLEKTVGAAARIEHFRIGSDPALFISGAPHGVALIEGDEPFIHPQRLAGPTLLLERDDLLIRIEGRTLTRPTATEIARSIPS